VIFAYVDYAIAFTLFLSAFYLQYRTAPSANSQRVFLYLIGSAVVSLGIGLAYSAALGGSPRLSVFFAKAAASATVGTFLLVVLIALSFPYEPKGRFGSAAVLAAWLAVTAVILFSDAYLVGMGSEGGQLVRQRGPLYMPVTGAGFALGLFSAALLLIRRSRFHSRIHRLQAAVAAFGLSLGYLISYLLAIVVPFFFGGTWAYALMPFGALVLGLSLGYALTVTRLFDPRAIGGAAIASVALYAPLALVAGAGVSFLSLPLMRNRPALGLLVSAAVFAAALYLVVRAGARFAGLFRRRDDIADRLDQSLSEIDYVQGRDYVIERLLSLMGDAFACNAVNLLVADADGTPRIVGSTNGCVDAFPKKSPAIDHILNNELPVVLKTEVVANYDFHEVKEELLDLFERFDADAFLIVRESRTIVGALLLGAKRTGADFTTRDFEALTRAYGKIFVAVYYLKNIAQESLVVTVDRELQFAEQIIQSIQEKIDKIEHPAADIGYMTRSTRKLGGDFIDFIRLSPDRFVFVLGDLAGKGLTASMSMVILKSVIRTYVKETKDFKSLIVKTNSFIKANLPRGTFFAGIIGFFDFAEKSLYFVNCGVPVMYLVSAAYANPVEMQGEGKVLGFVRNIEPHVNVRKVGFRSGDSLLVATDGVVDAESPRGARYGKERLQQAFWENRSQPAERVVRNITESVTEFAAQELNDDVTLFVLKIK